MNSHRWKRTRVSGHSSDTPSPLFLAESVVTTALEIALRHRQTVYDALYVAVATTQNCKLVTADGPLRNGLKNTPLQDRILWIEDIPNQN